MILTDVIKVAEPKWVPSKNKTVETKTAGALQLKSRYETIQDLFAVASREEATTLEKMKTRLHESFNQTRGEILVSQQTLPPELMGDITKDVLTRAAQTPRIEMSHVREIADKLGFIVMPFTYMDPRAYKGEARPMQEAIKKFGVDLSTWYNIYVLSPIEFYSVEQHVKSAVDLPIYAGPASGQAFMAIEMTIPMFRTLSNDVLQLKDHSQQMAKAINKTTEELKNLSRRVNDLQVQVDRQRQQAIIEAQENARVREQLEQMRQQRSFLEREPLLLAVPKSSNINDNCSALVGPCWGPDFNDIVFTSVGLKKIAKQRDEMAAKALTWGGSSATRTSRTLSDRYFDTDEDYEHR